MKQTESSRQEDRKKQTGRQNEAGRTKERGCEEQADRVNLKQDASLELLVRQDEDIVIMPPVSESCTPVPLL